MEIDSKPEVMDKLERRLIQLKIEQEAVKKEKDEASRKRFKLIEEEIKRLEKEYSDLEEIWKAEKAQVQGKVIEVVLHVHERGPSDGPVHQLTDRHEEQRREMQRVQPGEPENEELFSGYLSR